MEQSKNNTIREEEAKADSFAVSLGVSLSALAARKEKIREEVNSAWYLDPRFDAGFKKLLGTKDALRSFLNGVLAPMKIASVDSLLFKNIEMNLYTPECLQLRMDIRAKTAEGLHVNVEMQKAPLTFIRERILLQESAFVCVAKKEYDLDIAAKYPGDSDEDRAMRERFRYDFPYTFAIWICDFSINGANASAINSAASNNARPYHDSWHVYSDAKVREGTALPVSEKIKYILIDLGKFNKSFEELENDEDRWLYLLKNAGGATAELPSFNDAAIDDAVARIRISKTDDETKEAQVACRMSVEEQIGRLAMAFVDGKEEGREEGRKEGREEREKLAADIAAKDADIAAKDADIAAKDAEIRELKAQLETFLTQRG